MLVQACIGSGCVSLLARVRVKTRVTFQTKLKREKREISQFTQENFSTPSFLFVIVSQKYSVFRFWSGNRRTFHCLLLLSPKVIHNQNRYTPIISENYKFRNYFEKKKLFKKIKSSCENQVQFIRGFEPRTLTEDRSLPASSKSTHTSFKNRFNKKKEIGKSHDSRFYRYFYQF